MTATNATTTPAQLSAIARECFRTGGLAMRTLQHLRPHICPFEELLPEIPEGARVLAVADQYCALVSERAYREGINPVLVAGKFRASPGTAFDPRVVAALLAQLGPYPPGALVHLAGGQIGVVCARTRSPQSPIVMACVSPQGVRYPVPRKKATSDSTSAIDRPMPQGALTPFPDAAELWADAYDVPARPPG